jgi:hypothetical protein
LQFPPESFSHATQWKSLQMLSIFIRTSIGTRNIKYCDEVDANTCGRRFNKHHSAGHSGICLPIQGMSLPATLSSKSWKWNFRSRVTSKVRPKEFIGKEACWARKAWRM